MPDMRLIDENGLIYKKDAMFDIKNLAKEIARQNNGVDDITVALKEAYDRIKAAPTINAVPVVHGRWVKDTYNGRTCCSACKVDLPGVWYYNGEDEDENYEEIDSTPYCPNCGAKMRGETNEE